MRQDIELCNFTAGELSPKLKGRTDYARYFNGCDTCLNMVVLPQGGAMRRPGFALAGLTYWQTEDTANLLTSRLVRFVFSTEQAYILEFSAGNITVYADDAVVTSAGAPVIIGMPWHTADLPLLRFVQSADTLYITHPNYAPRTLTRSSNTDWTLSTLAIQDGPYLDVNGTPTTLTPSATSGDITITASSIVGINVTPSSTGQGFIAHDVGRLLRIRMFSLWAWCKITAVNSSTSVDATVQSWVENNGAYGAIDGAAWVANTLYPTGAAVLNNGNYYIAITGGTSGVAPGPDGTGSNLIDGTVTWSLAGPFDAQAWAQYTTYAPGDVVYSTPPSGSGSYYQCTTGGSTGGSSSPPTGTGTNITPPDQTCIWESIAAFVFPVATTFWQLGKWYGADGSTDSNHPQIPLFWQQRLCFLGSTDQPGAVEASVASDFGNFAPTEADATVTAANALSWIIASDEVDDIRWATGAGSSIAMQLAIGTSGGEWVMQPATNSQGLSASNVQVYQETKIGGAALPSGVLRIGKSVLFADRPGRKLYEWVWQWAINGFMAIDRTVDAEHITRPNNVALAGITMMAWQQSPYGVIWCVRGDGALIGLTWLPDERVIAWHRHQLGGDYNGGPPLVESIACIPSPDGSYDELWASVRRTKPDGTILRTVEVMTRYFDGVAQEQSFFVDSGVASALVGPQQTLYLGADLPVGAAGVGVTGTLTTSGDVWAQVSVGDYVRANNGVLRVVEYDSPTQVKAVILAPIANRAPAAPNAWSATDQYSSFSGLAHLAGQTVQVLGDGADFGTQAVSAAGGITLAGATASYAIAGLPFTYDLVTMPWAPERAAPVPPHGKTKTIDHLYLRMDQTLGVKVGRRKTDPLTFAVTSVLEPLQTRFAATAPGQPPALLSGLVRTPLRGGFDIEGQIEITGSGPYPCTVLAISASADAGGV